jgi:hypothetical protein
MKKYYQAPELTEISLVPEEATLEVCKNHYNAGDVASNVSNCSWHGQTPGSGGTWKVCKGVTGS